MYQAVASQISRHDLAIFTAAVADYTPSKIAEQKLKKGGDEITLTLRRTKDILGSAREVMGFGGILVGFAAEPKTSSRTPGLSVSKRNVTLSLQMTSPATTSASIPQKMK